MNLRTGILLSLIIVCFISCQSRENENLKFTETAPWLANCSTQNSFSDLQKFENEHFAINISKNWMIDETLAQNNCIYSGSFSDTSVVPIMSFTIAKYVGTSKDLETEHFLGIEEFTENYPKIILNAQGKTKFYGLPCTWLQTLDTSESEYWGFAKAIYFQMSLRNTDTFFNVSITSYDSIKWQSQVCRLYSHLQNLKIK